MKPKQMVWQSTETETVFGKKRRSVIQKFVTRVVFPSRILPDFVFSFWNN